MKNEFEKSPGAEPKKVELGETEKGMLGQMRSLLELSGEELQKKWIEFFRNYIGGHDPDNIGEERGMVEGDDGSPKSDDEVKKTIGEFIEHLETTGRIRY